MIMRKNLRSVRILKVRAIISLTNDCPHFFLPIFTAAKDEMYFSNQILKSK